MDEKLLESGTQLGEIMQITSVLIKETPVKSKNKIANSKKKCDRLSACECE